MRWFIILLLTFAFAPSIALAQPTAAPPAKPTSRPGGDVTTPPKRDVPGKRVTLSTGELFIPDFFAPSTTEPTQMVLWSLGANWITEQNFYDARKNAVLLTLNPASLKEGFADPVRVSAMLDEVSADVAKEFPGARPVGRVCLGSFSGGWTVVRDILSIERFRWLITDVVLADSLYAMRGIGEKKEIDPDAIQPFVDFAQQAAKGKNTFIFSQLYPPEDRYRGNTTTIMAMHLIERVKAQRAPGLKATNSAGAKLLYRAELKNFHVFGYAGMTNQDHFNHLFASSDLLKLTTLTDAAPPPAPAPPPLPTISP